MQILQSCIYSLCLGYTDKQYMKRVIQFHIVLSCFNKFFLISFPLSLMPFTISSSLAVSGLTHFLLCSLHLFYFALIAFHSSLFLLLLLDFFLFLFIVPTYFPNLSSCTGSPGSPLLY